MSDYPGRDRINHDMNRDQLEEFESDATMSSTWQRRPVAVIFFVAFLLVLLWAAGRILAPFLDAILIAAIVVTFTYPWYRRLSEMMKNRRELAAVVMLIVVTVTIVIPSFFLMTALVHQATTLFDLIQNADANEILASLRIEGNLARIAAVIPGFDPDSIRPDQLIVGVIEKIPGWVASYGGKLLSGLTGVAIGFVFMILAAYYFYVEGERLVKIVEDISPLPEEYERQIVRTFTGVVDATFRGQILTALAQGAVTSIGLAIAGIPGWLFWGAVASLFSLIPMVGAAAVWAPGAIYLFAVAALKDTSWTPAIFLAIWGIAVVSLIDNLIRPWAMKSGTNMSAIVLFFSIVGGLRAFGFVGLIIGPLVFALLVTFVQMFRHFFASEAFGDSSVSPPVAER